MHLSHVIHRGMPKTKPSSPIIESHEVTGRVRADAAQADGAGLALAPISEEFSLARLPDRRLTRRLGLIAEGLVKNPSESFPKAAGSVAALEATYRFLNNDAVTPEVILDAHREATCGRIALCGEVLVVHDTTSFEFRGESARDGLGYLRSGGQGFFSHVALALESDGSRRPLGVLSHETLVRTGERKGKRSHKELLADPDNESKRWLNSVESSEALAGGVAGLIHVMDREADAYGLMSSLIAGARRFVIRSTYDRVTGQPSPDKAESGRAKSAKVSDKVAQAVVVTTREVPVSKRTANRAPAARKNHPPRQYRVAHLEFKATKVELARPSYLPPDLPKTLSMHVVQVDEVDVVEGLTPVCWTLYTTEPIDTPEDILRVVDIYRARWTIEEYFKALKQGCAFETRQLDSLKSLLVALAIFMPIAWRLLLLRSTAREDGDRPATDVLSDSQVAVLVATSKGKLTTQPTVRQAMLAIAARGGHIPSNGEPGWQVLGRGFHELLVLEAGWNAARAGPPLSGSQTRPSPRCDPS